MEWREPKPTVHTSKRRDVGQYRAMMLVITLEQCLYRICNAGTASCRLIGGLTDSSGACRTTGAACVCRGCTGARHVVLAAAYATRALVPGRGDPGHAGVHGPVCSQTEHSRSKIRNASSLSSQCRFQRLAPRLVTGVHTVTQPALSSLAAGFGTSSIVKVKRYPNLPLLSPPALVSRSASAFNYPLHLASTASLRPTAPSGYRRAFRQSRNATVGSGLRLCVKDEVLQVCVLLATQGVHSRIRWSSSHDCQHVISSDIRPYNKKFLDTSPVLHQEVSYQLTSCCG
jgi:hypothetical protein